MRFVPAALASVLTLAAFGAPRAGAEAGAAPPQSAREPKATVQPVSQARQLVVVVTDSWSASSGQLWRFAKRDSQWREVGTSVPVSLGRRGLAWGRGAVHLAPSGTVMKREGDGKSPAGIFPLGTAFGSAADLPETAKGYPYLAVRQTSYCVEDTRSEQYNQIIDSSAVDSTSWQRWSPLSRADGLFRWGVFVEQNTEPTRIGAGSCIFLHVWRGPGIGTAGCTAMPEEAIAELIAWLEPEAAAQFVQLPRSEYERVADQHHLPRLRDAGERRVQKH